MPLRSIGGVSATDILSSAVWLLAAAETGPCVNGELHNRCSGDTGARGWLLWRSSMTAAKIDAGCREIFPVAHKTIVEW
ncbi:MAG TPA: hypothetical protein VMU62_00970 [Acidobacteriaceae bacterium]|nr:hypothetical protein [Acidobacteriaceae bacterium]